MKKKREKVKLLKKRINENKYIEKINKDEFNKKKLKKKR